MTLFRRDNGIYYFKFEEDGRTVWKSTGCRTKSEALLKVKTLKREPRKREQPPAAPDIAVLVLEFTASNYARRTHEIYEIALRRLRECFPDSPLTQLTPRHADKYKLWRLEAVTPTTLNIELRTLRSAFNLVRKWGLVKENPFAGTQLFRIPERPPAFLTRKQYEKLMDSIGTDWIRDIVVFAVCTGMRQGEILHLEWQHVDMDRRIVHVTSTATFKTKMGKRRVVPLNEKAMDVVRRQPRTGQFVFTMDRRQIRRDTLTHAFKKQVKALGLSNDIHFHSLRHTFASWLVQDGVSLYQVGRLLGHSDTKTTEIYAHLQPETMHDVVDRLKMG
jgi:integrase